MGEEAIFQYGKLVDVHWLADAAVAAGIGPTIKEGKGSKLYVRKGEMGKFLGDEFLSFKRIEGHLVSFVGANDLLLDEQLVKLDGTAQASLQSARKGYAFEGWFEDGASAAYDFSVPPTGDLKLKGRWRDEGATKYAVTFVAEGDDGQLLEEATVAIAADGWASGVYVVRVGARDGALRALRAVKGEGSRFGALGAREGAWSPGVREFVEICIPLQQ